MAKQKIGLIFDSTAIISAENIKKYDVRFVSLNLAIDGENHAAMSINEDEFRANFSSYKSMKSGSPSPHDFEEAMNKLFDDGYEEVVVVTLSSKLSATYDVALLGANNLAPERQKRTFIHDSLYASIGQDVLFTSLLPILETNPTATELISALEARRDGSVMFFELNDLLHLVKGGRLNPLKYILSLAFKIKPLIEFSAGELKVVAQNRNREKTLNIILEKIDAIAKAFSNVFINLFTYRPEDNIFTTLYDTIVKRWPKIILGITKRIDPVFMTHVGINGYAVSVVCYN